MPKKTYALRVGEPQPLELSSGAKSLVKSLLSLLLAMLTLLGCGGAQAPVVGSRQATSVSSAPPLVPQRAPEDAALSDAESPVVIEGDDPVWGKRGAPLTIVMFGDYQCPFTARVQSTIEQIKSMYGPEKVRVVWKNMPLPFHATAKPAAEAATGVFALAGNDAFWKFHAVVFKNQKQLEKDNYIKWAVEAGVDEAKLRRGLEAHTWAEKVDRDIAFGNSVKVFGTPHFFINGISLSGAQPLQKFVDILRPELVKAEAEMAKGTSSERIYQKMSKLNWSNAPPRKEEPAQPEDKTIWKVPIGASPTGGPDGALVTIVEFADFQCPFSKRVEETLKRVRDAYGDKVRIVWKNEPLQFHLRAEPAAQVAAFAFKHKGKAGFWAAHDRLFELQPELEDANLEGVARGLGLDVGAVMRAVQGHSFKNVIDATFRGYVITALAQGIVTAIGLVIAGVPAALFWGAVATVMSLVPFVGVAAVWVPATIYLYVSAAAGKGAYWQPIFLTVWGLAVVSTIDNVVRPFAMRGRSQLPAIPLLFSVLGGMQAFGFIGLVIGPLVFSLLMSIIDIYKRSFRIPSAQSNIA